MNSNTTPVNEHQAGDAAGFWDDADVIHVMTRANLIDDGSLIEVDDFARRVGFRFPLAISRAVWCELPDTSEQEARLFELLMLAKIAATTSAELDRAMGRPSGNRANFQFDGMDLYLHIGPGDCPKPVLTIMLQGED